MQASSLFALAIVLGTNACGSDVRTPDSGSSSDVDPFTPPAGFTRLVGRTWDLPTGANIYKCVRLTVTEDTYITNIVAQAPLGTHHSVLSLSGINGTAGPDGEVDCAANNIGMNLVYAAGVGTSPLDFPSNVGIKIAAG